MSREPAQHLFADDGLIPNSRLPLLVYPAALAADAGPASFERLFARHGWSGSWRDGIHPFHHYHSNAHEVLGIYEGKVKVLFGGEAGIALEASAGDVVVIPAGVGHKRLEATPDLGVVGAYPDGRAADLCRGRRGDRPAADTTITAVPVPATDPVAGADGPLPRVWAASLSAGLPQRPPGA